MSVTEDSGASTTFNWLSRSAGSGGVFTIKERARPMVAKKVLDVARISDMHVEAENLRRKTTEAPLPMAGKMLENKAFPWKSGMAQ